MGLLGPICQSCTMPISQDKDKGTERIGGLSQEYCHLCYQQGAFVDPRITVDGMYELVRGKMVEMHFPGFLAKMFAKKVYGLKRWQSSRSPAEV